MLLTMLAILLYLSLVKLFLEAGGQLFPLTSSSGPSPPASASPFHSPSVSFHYSDGNAEKVAEENSKRINKRNKEYSKEREGKVDNDYESLDNAKETKERQGEAEGERERRDKAKSSKGRQDNAKEIEERQDEELHYTEDGSKYASVDSTAKQQVAQGHPRWSKGSTEKEEEDLLKATTPGEMLPSTLEVELTLSASGVTVWVEGEQVRDYSCRCKYE